VNDIHSHLTPPIVYLHFLNVEKVSLPRGMKHLEGKYWAMQSRHTATLESMREAASLMPDRPPLTPDPHASITGTPCGKSGVGRSTPFHPVAMPLSLVSSIFGTWCRYLARWFTLTLYRSDSKVKVVS